MPTSPTPSPHGIPRRLHALAALGLAGTAVSIYLTQHYYEVRNGSAGFQSFCNLGQAMNCDVVAASSYAQLLPGMPLSSFAAGWFLALFVVALLARDAFWRREAVRALTVLSGVAALMSVLYLGVMAFVIHTFCLFCLVTDAIGVTAFALVLSLKPESFSLHKPDTSKWKTFASVTAFALGLSLIGLRVLDDSQFSGAQIQDSVKTVMDSPVLAVNAGPEFPSIGPANAPITIVEYSDFQCPYCRIGAFSINTVLSRYPTQVRVVFRNFPLDQACNRKIERMMHAHACEAAKTAICAHKQGKFIPVYEALFEKQESLSGGAAGITYKIAQDAGADAAQLNDCVSAPETGAAVSRDIEEALNLGIQSTPTFFINGHRVEGGKPPEVWSRIIDELLKTAK
jgi:protein-disulfide isomerase